MQIAIDNLKKTILILNRETAESGQLKTVRKTDGF